MKKFFKITSLTKSGFFSKLGKKKRSVKDDFEEVSELPESIEIMNESLIEENEIIEQVAAPAEESFIDSLQKMEIFESKNQCQTLLVNKIDETFSTPINPNFEKSNTNIVEPISLNVSNFNTLKLYEKEKQEKSYTIPYKATNKENDIMQKKIDDLEKISEKQASEISELKSLLNDCVARLNSLEGGPKGTKDKTTPTPNSLKISATKTKDVQLRKSLVSPRTPVKSARLSGTPTRRSTSDLAKNSEKKIVLKKPWRPPGQFMICPIIIKAGKVSKKYKMNTQKITNQICNQLTYNYAKNSKISSAWKPPGISLLFCNFRFIKPSNPKKPVLKLNITLKQTITKEINDNHKEATFVKGEGLLRLFIKGRPINLCIPTTLAGDFNIKCPAIEPDENLRMEWVYGYRGKDCRKNVYYLPTGDLVYFVAGIIILHNLKTEIQRHYVEHTDDVKCLALHPDKVTFASGQVAGHAKVEGKPHVRIWSSLSLQTLHIIGLGFFERAVSALGFSKSDGGKLLCTVDDANDHNLTVWNWSVAKSVSTSKSSTEAVIEVEFNPVDSNVIVSCGKNHLAFWTIEKSGLVKKMAIFEKYEKPKFVTCAIFTSSGELITGDSSGNIFFWSKEKRQITSAINQAHSGPVFSLQISEKGSLLSGGGKDHAIYEWDLSTKEKSEKTIDIPSEYGHCRTISEFNNKLIIGTTNNNLLEITEEGEVIDLLNGHSDEVWALANHPTKEQFVSAGYDHKIIVWDALTHNIVLSKQIDKAIQSISINESADMLAIGCNDGHWMIYDLEKLDEIFQSQDGNEPIQCCEFSPDDFPILQLNTNCLSFSKLAPMYPKALVDCVSLLNTNLLKESIELINKCYVLKSFEMKGIGISFLLPVISYGQESSKHYVKTGMLEQCDIVLNEKLLLYPDNWKTTSLLLREINVNVSTIELTLIPSHLKACIVIIGSNYPWIVSFRTQSNNNYNYGTMYKRLDDFTSQILGAHSFLIESCHQCFYQNQTYELHLCLPNLALQSRETSTSSFIDARMFHETLLLFLRKPETSFTIPVLDNKDDDKLYGSKPVDLFILSCQIPKQIKPVHCTFNLKCQIGSINFLFSQQLITWFIYPLLDLDLDKYIKSDIFPTFSTLPKSNSTNHSNPTIPDIRSMADGSSRPESPNMFYNKHPVPGHPKSISNNTEKLENKPKFLSNKIGWWNVVKDSCSKYFFLLQSLDVCVRMFKSKFYITSITDMSNFKSKSTSCTEWVNEFFQNKQEDGSIFVIKMTRIALINSQRREYLHETFQTSNFDSLNFQKKPTKIIDSLPWELIFHDIRIDCVYSSLPHSMESTRLLYDSILKPVSINCTLSATPKCMSPDKLDSLYSVSWGVHVDITEVQPTLKQIYLSKILNLFGNIVLGLPWTDFVKNLQCIITGHYIIVKENLYDRHMKEDNSLFKSKQSISTKSTKRSKSSIRTSEDLIISSPKNRIANSKLETQTINEIKSEFKMSFWIQCTLSQFQLIIVNEKIDKNEDIPYVYSMLQVDDTTSCIDVQEKFVEIKGKLSSVLCQIGLMKRGKMISEIPILKTGSKFVKSPNIPFSYKSLDESIRETDEMCSDNAIRHCFSIAIIRTTINNLSKRPISSYHQFSDTESFKSYPTEFTGNFSTAIDLNKKYQTYVTQISSIIDPFDLYLPPFFLNQCIELSNTFVLLCNQVYQTSIQKWSIPKKDASPLSACIIRNEPYFITEDMPQFHLLVKSSRIIFPRYKNEKASIYDEQITENGCIIMSWNKISLQPFSNNAISRPQIIEKETEETFSSDSESKCILCLEDNRQFQLDIFHYGIYLNHSTNSITPLLQNPHNFEGIQFDSNQSSDVCITSIIHGQNPAFEWNNVSKLSSFVQTNSEIEFVPIMKPIDIQIIFAGAIHDSSSTILKRKLAGGYGLEINLLTNLEFFLDNYSMDMIQSITSNVTDIFNDHNEHVTNKSSVNENKVSDVYSMEEFCQMKNIDNFIPCVPINVLMTSRKIQIYLLQMSTNVKPQPSVHGISISIFQPHAMLSFTDRQNHKFEIAFFDVCLSVTPFQWSEKINFSDQNQSNFWINRESFLLAEMKTIMKTKPGRPDIKTGVPASLLSVIFKNFSKSSVSQCSVNITRQVLVNIGMDDITQLSGLLGLLSNRFQSTKTSESSNNHDFPFPWFVLVPSNLCLSTEQFSVTIFDNKYNENQFELKIGPLNISSNLIRNYQWNILYLKSLFRCDNIVIIQTLFNAQKPSKFILYPLKITGEATLGCYRFNALEDYWKSYERILDINFDVVNLDIEEDQMINMCKLLKIFIQMSYPKQEFTTPSNITIKENVDNRVEIFYDELRTNKFQFITSVASKENDYIAINGSNLIADEGTISFSDDNDDVVSMLWTYPEPRCIISLEVKPVPFVFIECNFMKDDSYEQLQIPCKLEYWNISTNQYEVCQSFHLSENRIEKMENLPTLEQLSQLNPKVIVAKSWRVVIDCYARIVSEDKKIKPNVEKAMLVYLSPLVLAASMMVDSCYCPFLVTRSLIKLSVPQIELTFHENEWEENGLDICKPYKLITKTYEDYSISHHDILFKCSLEDILFKYSINKMKEIYISNVELFLSDPFLALQLPIATIEKLKGTSCSSEINEEQISVEVDACQFGFDTIALKQSCVTFERLTRMINKINESSIKMNSTKYEKSQFIFCNNLNRRIRIKQKDDDFMKVSDNSNVGGIGFGEAVMMKFIPFKSNMIKDKGENMINVPNEKIELILGLCSELKGITKWTDPIELPVPNFNDISMNRSRFGIWRLDKNIRPEVSILTNSSSLSNSFNSRNLFFIHTSDANGLNKINIFGNTVIKNLTSQTMQINFSLPTEISSGVSFTVPPQINSVLFSQYINWKFIATSNLRNIFELSFRITNNTSENMEYRSLSYQMEVPKCNNHCKINHYQQQMIIRLKLYKIDGKIISSRNLHCQFLCSLEWFAFSDAEEMFLLITASPLIIFQNQMLRDVRLEISNTSTNDQGNSFIKEEHLIVQGRGGNLKLMNLFPIDVANLNASFENDSLKLFENPLIVTEEGILESLSRKLNNIYENKFNKKEDSEKLKYIADLILLIFENIEYYKENQYIHSPYSVMVTITPWLLISNRTDINLVLNFDNSIYFLEANNDFVPPQSNKPIKLGITFENDVYWSAQFLVGQEAMKQSEIASAEILWNFGKDCENEGILQTNIKVGRNQYLVPLTLKHMFVDEIPNMESSINTFCHLIIESTVFITNQCDMKLAVESTSLKPIMDPISDILDAKTVLFPKLDYKAISQFQLNNLFEDDIFERLIVKINLVDKDNLTSSFNYFKMVNFNIFSEKSDNEIQTKTDFLYLGNNSKEPTENDYEAFIVNTSVNLKAHKIFLDIFPCKYFPIIFHNGFSKMVLISESVNKIKDVQSSVIQIQPNQYLPYWPIDYQMGISKDGCGDYSNLNNIFKIGIPAENGIDWTEYLNFTFDDLPSTIEVSTLENENHFKLILNPDNCAMVRIDIFHGAQVIKNAVIEPSRVSIKKLSILKCSFSLLERQADLATLVESFRVSIENFVWNLTFYSINETSLYEIDLSHIQIDNKLFSSGFYDFPVVLNSRNINRNDMFLSAQIKSISNSNYSLNITFHDEIELFLENLFLFDLLRIFSQLIHCLTSKSRNGTSSSFGPYIHINSINLSPINLSMTVHAFVKIYVSCEATSLRLPEFVINNSTLKFTTLQKLLWQHYVTAVLLRFGYVLGSIELFGNPSGIFRHLATGFTNLLSSRNIDHGLLVDFLLRLVSFCRHTSGGFISSFTGIASSLSRNLDYFSLDDTHIIRQDLLRRNSQSVGVMHGFMRGLSGLALSLLGAVAGLADQPIQASQEALNSNSSVSIAVIKGLGKGLIGAVAKPLSGTAELFAQTGRGLLNTTGIAINRCHSNLLPFTLISKSNILINVTHFLHIMLDNDIINEDTLPIIFWSSFAENDEHVPVYLCLTKHYLIEWLIDNPLRNKNNFYCLLNFNISVSSPSPSSHCLRLQYVNKIGDFTRNDFLHSPNVDNRINAFISDLQYAKDPESAQTTSRTSSVDSTDYVKFSCSPNAPGTGIVVNNLIDSGVLCPEEFNFHSSRPLDGILTALTFLASQRDQRL